jgi:hypothetical protein
MTVLPRSHIHTLGQSIPVAAEPTGGLGVSLTPTGAMPPSLVAAPTMILSPGDAGGTITTVANQAWLTPMLGVVTSTPLTRAVFRISTQSGNMDIGYYYTDDETNFVRVFSTGSFATPAAGMVTKTHDQQWLVPSPGRQWFWGMAFSNALAAFRGGGTSTMLVGFTKTTSFPLPATITAPTTGTQFPHMIGLV